MDIKVKINISNFQPRLFCLYIIKVVMDLLIHNGIIEEQYFSLETLLYVEEPFS